MQQEADRVRSFSRRAIVLGAAQVGLFGALVARLYHLQVREGHQYALLAEDNRVNQRLIIPSRGRILDRHDRQLANNIPTYRVRIVREQARDLRETLARLARVIPIEPKRIEEVIAQAQTVRAFVAVSVREDLDWEEVSRIALATPDLPGVVLDSGLLRQYPEAELLAHVLGYVGAVNVAEQQADPDPLLQLPDFRIGKSGIESSYEKKLRGSAGLSRIEINALGREIRELDRDEGEAGQDLRLSLDLELQRFAYERLSAELSASAVCIDIRTGGIVTLASVPSFAPKDFQNGLSHALWIELRDNPRTPLVNKSIRGQYPPGSTFKMVTAMAGLENGAITPSTRIGCSGVTRLGAAKFHCWKEHGHGSLNLAQAIAQSCDCFFYEVARRVGIDALAETANELGLGHKLGIDLPGEQPGLIPTSAWKKKKLGVSWQKGETLICGIGQGFVSTTPLQLAVMTARLASGRQVTPTFMVDPKASTPQALKVDRAALDSVLFGMREVIHGARGTAKIAKLDMPGIEMGGKTGTSQVRRITAAERAIGYKARGRLEIPWKERDHALFVCFAPYHDPIYAVAVVVEHGEHGGTAAAPIARDIMRRALEIHPGGITAPSPSASLAPEAGPA